MSDCVCMSCRERQLNNERSNQGRSRQTLTKMILCPLCGHRRCPKATYHGNDCTGSDDPHQEGSRYNWKVPEDLGKSDDPDYVQPKVRPLNEM